MMSSAKDEQQITVFIDLDGTILRKESQLHFLVWSIRHGLVNRLQALALIVRYLLYVTGVVKNAMSLRDDGFMLMKGIQSSLLESEIRRFLNCFASEIRAGVPSLLEHHRQRGHQIVLVTSAMEPLARQFGQKMGIDKILATHLHKERGIYTGRYDQPSPWGEGKRMLIEAYCCHHRIVPEKCYAYSDHVSDIDMLQYIGRPVAVNPHKPLARIAREKGWPVLDLDLTR